MSASEALVNDSSHGEEHKLMHEWTFWYLRKSDIKKEEDYNTAIHQIASFSSLETFWKIYDHIVRPNAVKDWRDYHLFKKEITPTWEDPANKDGGKWMIRLRKGLASRYWEELVLAVIGEQFGDDLSNEITGAVVAVRSKEDIVSIWHRNSDNFKGKNKIQDAMRKILRLPGIINIEYKKHEMSKTDGSGYHNSESSSSAHRGGTAGRGGAWKSSPRASDGAERGGSFKDRPAKEGGASAGTYEKRSGGGGSGTGGRGMQGGRADRDRGNRDRDGDKGDFGGQGQSTGDPLRDAANALKAKTDETQGQNKTRHVPANAAWGSQSSSSKSNSNSWSSGGSSAAAGGSSGSGGRQFSPRERGGSGEAPERGAEASGSSWGRSDSAQNATVKRVGGGLPGLMPALRSDGKPRENSNVWRKAEKTEE
jgi:translation initiation factor 4E